MTTNASVVLPPNIHFPFARPRPMMQHGTKRSYSFDFDGELANKRIRTASAQPHSPTPGSDNNVLNATTFERQRTFASPRGLKEREFAPRVTAAGADRTRSTPTAPILDIHTKTADDDDASTPRIVDLSTGDVLERVPLPNERVSRQKGKRTLEENGDNVNIIQTLMVSKTNWRRAGNDSGPLVDFSPPNKKFRTNEAAADQDYFVEEVDEEGSEPVVVSLDNDTVCATSSADDCSTSTNPQCPYDLSLVVRNSNNGKVKFAVPYHEAFTSYMRSQFGNLKDEAWANKAMQLVLFRSQPLENSVQGCPLEADEDSDTGCQVYEITESDEGEINMADAEVVNSDRINVGDSASEDQMDVD